MKCKTTKKQLKNLYNLYKFGYCEIQYLLQPFSPIYYTAWIYGRCEDVYKIGDFYISTWYSPTGESVDYNLYKKYEAKAQKLWYCWDKRRAKCEKLIIKMLEEAKAMKQ